MGCGLFIHTTQQQDYEKPSLLKYQGVWHRREPHKCNKNSNKGGVTEGQSSHHRMELNSLTAHIISLNPHNYRYLEH